MSWQLNRTWLGNLPRPGSPNAPSPPDYPGNPQDYPWLPDNILPSNLERVNGSEYRGSSFDKGHLAPNADRNRIEKDQFATFLTTNLLPQHPDNNRRGTAWERLEAFSRSLVEDANKELYIIAGGADESTNYSPGEAYPGNPLNFERINIPESTWKVIVVLEPGQSLADISIATPIIGVVTPNNSNPQVPDAPDVTQWSTWIRSVDYIEEITGLDLLSNLPDEVEQVIEREEYSGSTTVEGFLT